MKILLLILLFLLFVIVAIAVYGVFYIRAKVYKDLVYICKSLKNNISFNKKCITDILSVSIEKSSVFTRCFFRNCRSNKVIFLSKSDQSIINDFLESIGNGDVEYEINNINYYENYFQEIKSESQDKLTKDGKMYLKLIIGVGVAICIILI